MTSSAETQASGSKTGTPSSVYWLSAAVIYGWFFSYNLPEPFSLGVTFRDIWQHLSALQALLESPLDPSNPFVATRDASRLFTPTFVLAGLLGHGLNWSQTEAYIFSAGLNLILMAAGIYIFAKAFFGTPWGPAALLASTVFGAWFPFLHTGLQSPACLIEGTGYPAITSYGLALLIWGLGIRVLDGARSRWVEGLVVVSIALSVPQHQLGAGIALIGLTAFAVAWPAETRERFNLAVLALAGLLLAALWPYFDPYALLFTAGRSEWSSAIDFYSAELLAQLFLPIIVGLFWIPYPLRPGSHRPILLAGGAFVALYAIGLFGSPVAHRMILPVALLLEILMAGGLIRIVSGGMTRSKMWILSLWAAVTILWLANFLAEKSGSARRHNYLESALQLTADLPPDEIVAGHFMTSGPLTAVGRKVLSSQLPEPLVSDMAERRRLNDALFDPVISLEERRGRARKAGVAALFVDERNIDSRTLAALTATVSHVRRSGPLVRLDP